MKSGSNLYRKFLRGRNEDGPSIVEDSASKRLKLLVGLVALPYVARHREVIRCYEQEPGHALLYGGIVFKFGE